MCQVRWGRTRMDLMELYNDLEVVDGIMSRVASALPDPANHPNELRREQDTANGIDCIICFRSLLYSKGSKWSAYDTLLYVG